MGDPQLAPRRHFSVHRASRHCGWVRGTTREIVTVTMAAIGTETEASRRCPVDVGWKLKVDNLYKIFGGSELEALEASRAGATRDEIHRNLGSVAAVAGISFSVREGEVFVVMGLSG